MSRIEQELAEKFRRNKGLMPQDVMFVSIGYEVATDLFEFGALTAGELKLATHPHGLSAFAIGGHTYELNVLHGRKLGDFRVWLKQPAGGKRTV